MNDEDLESPCGPEFPLDVFNDLQCPICLEFFKHPIILPCSHVLCRSPCAENLFDFNFIRCPVCRESCYLSGGLASLPRVIALESIIEKYRSERRKAIQSVTKPLPTPTLGSACGVVSPETGASAVAGGISVSVHGPLIGTGTSSLYNSLQGSEHSLVNASSVHGLTPGSINRSLSGSVIEPVPGSIHGSKNGLNPGTATASVTELIPGTLYGSARNSSHGSSRDSLHDSMHSPRLESPYHRQRHHTRSTCETLEETVKRTLLGTENALRSAHTVTPAFPTSENVHDNSGLAVTSTPRTLHLFDASLFDVSTDSVTSCSRHGAASSVYCHVCERSVCDVCGDNDHVTSHETNSLEDAAAQAKIKLSHNLDEMIGGQMKVLTSLEQQRQRLKDMEQAFSERAQEVNVQCDCLLAEVEHKRSLFLADLEHEERARHNVTNDVIEVLEKLLASSQSLALYTKDVMERDSASLLQVTPALNDQILGSIEDCEICHTQTADLHLDPTQVKVVDLRNEQCMLRDIHYLHPPGTPCISPDRCGRSDDTVALFLLPPHPSDVIDSYVIRYCSQDQKALGVEDTLTLHYPSEPDQTGVQTHYNGSRAGLVALLSPLRFGTPYLFCARASNRAGHSANSEAVQCLTLTPAQCVVPVPVIMQNQCQVYPTSIRVHTPSPRDVAPEQNISHFLLYRPRERDWLWRCVALCGKTEQRVFGLHCGTQYEFAVMATNRRGECQISQKVVLETERTS